MVVCLCLVGLFLFLCIYGVLVVSTNKMHRSTTLVFSGCTWECVLHDCSFLA